MDDQRVVRMPVYRMQREGVVQQEDTLALEEPLEISLDYEMAGVRMCRSISVTMRTPGHDGELATGFLFSEGIIQDRDQVTAVRTGTNKVTVHLKPDVAFDVARLERHFYTTSSCGVCGKASLEALRLTGCPALPHEGPVVRAESLYGLPAALLAAQPVFAHTGGLHAAALFDTTPALLALYEDVGRHNAMDKLIGACLREDGLPLHGHILLLSGRTSFELVQKALMAGIPLLAAVGAPSSLAVKLARAFGMTLIGFLRDGRFNIYSAPWRIREAAGIVSHGQTAKDLLKLNTNGTS